MPERSQEEMRTYQENRVWPPQLSERLRKENEEQERKRRLRERYPYSDDDYEFLTWNEYCYFHS